MVAISPFRALRPPPDRAATVASVPYDVVSESEARALAGKNPQSFLHVIRPEVDLDPGAGAPERFGRAKANLERFLAKGWLCEDAAPHVYVYRVGSQTGVAALFSTDDYRAGRIKRHELTRPEKEDDRTRLLETLQAHVGPVFLTHRDDPAVSAAVAAALRETPLYDFEADDGIRHTVWQARDAAPFVAAFAALDVYIADGHHRAASAARTDSAFLGVVFPASEVGILAYNRVVADLGELTPAQVRERLRLEESDEDRPPARGTARVYLDRRWYALTLDGDGLDCAILQDQVLGPVFNIGDPRTNPRIDFVGGSRGPEELVRLVDSGKAAIAFSMYPTSVAEVMDVSDRGETMPPKSTWFDPKLRSGLLVARTRG